MNASTINPGVPSPIVRKLRLVRQRKVWLHVASAIVTALAVLLAAMGLAMLIDWLATLYDSRWRVVLTVTAIAAALATAIGWLVVARRRILALNQIAGDVDRQIPQLQERWSTITRLGDDAANSNVVHPAMLRRVSTEAVSFEPHVEPEQVVPVSILMRSMIGLTAITAVLGIAVVMNTHQTFVLMRRFWAPSSLISATELVDLPGDVVIGRGEPLELNAAVNGTPVERATLFMQSEDASKAIKLVAHGTDPIAFRHRLRAVEEPFEYRFRAGDGQTEWYSVDVADRPEIEKLLLTVTPPAYTHKEIKTFEKMPQRVAAIQKSTLELAIRPRAPVETVVLKFGGDKRVNLTAADDGWYRWRTTLEEGFDFTTVLTESHGLTNRRPPKCSLSVYPDRPPAVKVLTPEDQMAVRPDEVIPITFSASDDVGIDSAELLVYDESAAGSETEPIATIPVDLGDQQGAKVVQQSVDLELAKFAAEHGAEISYEIRVREDRGGSQSQASPQNGPSTANVSSNSNSNATSSSMANDQSNASSQGDVPAPEGQPESSTAQTQPRPAAKGSSEEANRAAPGQPANDGRPSNSTIAKAAKQSGQPSAANGTKTPSESANQGATPDPKVADTRPTAEMPSSPNSSNSADPKSPPKDGMAAKKALGNSAAQSAADSNSPSRSSQNSAGSPPKSQTAQSNANRPSNPELPNNAATEQSAASGQDAKKMAKDSAATPGASSDDSTAPREATTGRKGLSANQMAEQGDQAQSEKSMSDPSNSKSESVKTASNSPATNAESKPMESRPTESNQAANGGSQQGNQSNNQSQSPSSSSRQTASNTKPNASSDEPSNDNMPKRMLDIPSSNTSKRMRLKIDELAGSFTGQQRAKLEMAIAPELEALDKALAKGQRTARGVLDQLEADAEWRGTHDRDVSSAEQSTVEAQEVISKLQKRSKDTPYAFIGLQVADIGLAHVDPARSDFWKALQSEGGDRAGSVRDGWQHLGRARELVAELRGQFERARREFQLAESVEKFKTMYQVFIENTQALLPTEADDPERYNRKNVEFKLDEEYLARLKEVLEMRRDLQAELARILAEDPRLLRRFMDSVRNRTNNLREELSDLVAEQEDLNREVRAWSMVEEADRTRMARLLMLRQVQDATALSKDAGELQSRYQAWLPLGSESKDPEVAAATKMVQEMATSASELGESAQQFIAEAQRVKAAASATDPQNDAVTTTPAGTADAAGEATPQPAQPAEQSLDPLLADGQRLYDQLNALDVSLRQLAARNDGGEAALFAANRLVDTRRLIADTSAWVRQMRAHNSGNYSGAAEVDQYRLAMKTDAFATKLSALEQSLAGSLQRTDGTLPEAIAKKSRELLATLDREAAPNQLAAVYALHSNHMPRATERQKSASEALAKSEKLYDELMRLAIAEMDKLPVQDPIASLLEDPTLDEILAQLEQELPIQELLGIPNRPSNLRIIGDWLRPNSGGGGGGARMASNQVRQDQQRMRRQLDRAYQRAVARALKEERSVRKVEIPKTKMSDWNKLVSELGDDLRQGRDKAPPEQYRRAIEQYFAEISRAVADQEKQAP